MRQFRKGDRVEWTEINTQLCNTGIITHLPDNLETGFVAIKDDDGVVHMMSKKKIQHLEVKVVFT